MSKDIGTLQEIGAHVGDVVDTHRYGLMRVRFGVNPLGHVGPWAKSVRDSTEWLECNYRHYRIISRANQGPVREVTTVRKEIVPGVYGRVCVSTADNNQVALKLTHQIGEYAMLDLSEMDALLATLTAIRDAMADSSVDVATVQAQ